MVKSLDTHDSPEVRGNLREYEEAIRQVREVMAARIVAGVGGDIEEIHVVAGGGRSPKQIVRDIESSLMAQFGLSIDHKKISVAQVDEGVSAAWGTGRVRLVSVRFVTDGPRAEADVKLDFDGNVHSGRACGPASEANRLRMVAEATLGAVAEYFNSDHQVSVDDVLSLDVRARRIVLVVMSLLTRGGEETLVGSSIVRAAEAEAVARAVLDALNRRFMLIVKEPASRRPPGTPDGGNEPDMQAP